MKPTILQSQAFETIYGYLNKSLFDNKLPDCMLRFTKRSSKTDGYFTPDSWSDGVNQKHEICLNPLLLEKGDKQKILEVLTHNMVHLYQHEFYSPPRKRYHNREWADIMESIDLVPSHTGQVGGKRTGDTMSQYPKPGGLFQRICNQFPKDYIIPFRYLAEERKDHKRRKNDKSVYNCRFCPAKTWGKPELEFQCLCIGSRNAPPDQRKMIETRLD